MKKTIMVGVAFILMLLLITSCGVPPQDYSKVVSDLASAQAQIQSLQRDLAAKESELSATQSKLSETESQLYAKESEIEALQGKLEQGKARAEILNAIIVPAITGELYKMTEIEAIKYLLEFLVMINAIGDPDLTTKFDEAIDSGMSEEALLDFYVYLIESIPKVLR